MRAGNPLKKARKIRTVLSIFGWVSVYDIYFRYRCNSGKEKAGNQHKRDVQ